MNIFSWLHSIYMRRTCLFSKHQWKFQADGPDSGKEFYCGKCVMVVGFMAKGDRSRPAKG